MRALSLTDVTQRRTKHGVVLHCRPIDMQWGVTCPCQSKSMMLAILIIWIIIFQVALFDGKISLDVFRFTVIGLL